MAETWFSLSQQDQIEAIEIAADRTGRPAHLLEKDIWVVYVLSAIYSSPLAKKLTFKGGTSLSKVYKVIDRFSEDIDLTYDIRELVPDLLRENNPIPISASQEKKISDAVRKRLPAWITSEILPVLECALGKSKLNVSLTLAGKEDEKLVLSYPALKTGTGYTASTVQLEFGARSTGEPNNVHTVHCDIASVLPQVSFPTAQPLVMTAERTFWEKATAAHVYCLQNRLRGERYSRHWYDLVALARFDYYESALSDKALAQKVAQHKSMFFTEKDSTGAKINYHHAVNGNIQLVPTDESLAALALDYEAMLKDGLLFSYQPTFSELIENCYTIECQINAI